MGHPPAVTPATGRQVRALQAAFADLGYTRRSDRPARLTAAATALGISRLDSFTDLTTGQAGILLRRLRSSELPDEPAGYVRLSISERREAVRELTASPEHGGQGLSQREAARVLGVSHDTVSKDLKPKPVRNLTSPFDPEPSDQDEEANPVRNLTPPPDPRLVSLARERGQREAAAEAARRRAGNSSAITRQAIAAAVILMWFAGALRERGPLLAQDSYRSTTRTSPAPKNARPAS